MVFRIKRDELNASFYPLSSFPRNRSRSSTKSNYYYSNIQAISLSSVFHWILRFVVRVLRSVVILAVYCSLATFLLWMLGTYDYSLPRKERVHYHDRKTPPNYSDYHAKELRLPQNNLSLPYPEGRDGKYLWIANRIDNLGWGNAMQEFLFNSYLAYEANRVRVFDNYTWDQYNGMYAITDDGLIPSKIPYSVFLSGPLVGGPWPNGDSHPRSVVKEYWDVVCPDKTIIDPRTVDGHLPSEATAKQVFDTWIAKLATLEDRCVEIKDDALQIFSYRIFGDPSRLLEIWPAFSRSPIMTEFRWSLLIEDGFHKNLHLFTTPTTISDISSYPYDVIPGLLAIHLRRGDFKDHCISLTDWASPWNGFNSFPEFMDKFTPPSGSGGGYRNEPSTPEGYAGYFEHCYPSIEQIVKKVQGVRKDSEVLLGKELTNLFVMTNGEKKWVKKLKKALQKAGKWENIKSSWDMSLNWEQKYVSQAVDMLIGQRADVIIGNGWSSLTSNVVMLRMANGLRSETNRFW